MRAAILAGGLGTRLQDETSLRPKPMVEVGGHPLLWHIMQGYARHNIHEFVVALGYKSFVIKDYFLNYHSRLQSLTVSLATGEVEQHGHDVGENWKVHLLDTGLNTMTGGRVKRVAEFIGNEPFMLTYGDGVSNIDISQLLAFHRRHGKLATLTAVRPPARFGAIRLDGDAVQHFEEKAQIDEGWINGGFMVLEPAVRDYIDGDHTNFEREPLERLVAEEQLMAYRHHGFWQCMDTVRDLRLLEEMWQSGQAPWRQGDTLSFGDKDNEAAS
jgi:glucose-1-phosphate cytidylyltransferase